MKALTMKIDRDIPASHSTHRIRVNRADQIAETSPNAQQSHPRPTARWAVTEEGLRMRWTIRER